jgi:hypothetical protein
MSQEKEMRVLYPLDLPINDAGLAEKKKTGMVITPRIPSDKEETKLKT